jgi:hypothetical protein
MTLHGREVAFDCTGLTVNFGGEPSQMVIAKEVAE